MPNGIRLIAAGITWLIAGVALAELVRGIVAVGQVGGYCREGGAVIAAIACPDGAPERIVFGGLGIAAAVILNVALAQGLGPDLPAVLFPGVFFVLGLLFLLGGFTPVRFDLVFPGVVFVVVGCVMLFLNRQSGWGRVAIGSRLQDGTAIARSAKAMYHRSVPYPGERAATSGEAAGLALLGWGPFFAGVLAGVLV